MTFSVDLTAADEAYLDLMCEQDKVTRDEIVEAALKLYFHRCRKLDASGAFGMWKDRNEDAFAYLDRIRNGG